MSHRDPTRRVNRLNRPPSFIPLVSSKENINTNSNNNNNNSNSINTNNPAQNTPNQPTTNTTPQLHKVLGVTNPTVAAICCSADGVLAYPAGCVVVLYDVKRDTQSYLMNATRKAIISLSWSPDGRYIVTGEQGHKPLVRVWEYSSLRELVSLAGHTHGIDYVKFHPDQNYVISVGAEHDKSVFVWCWRSQSKIGANNKTFKVNCMSVSEDGSFFVLVGLRTVRFCQFDAELSHRSRRVNSVVSRAAVLGAHQSLNYIAVCCSKAKFGATGIDRLTKTYVLSQRGIMLILNSEREVVSWFDTQIRQARCIAVIGNYFFCGGINALVRIFEIPSFQYVTCMPLAMSSETGDKNKLFLEENRYHPTALSLTIFQTQSMLISSYSNHSIYIWNIDNLLNPPENSEKLIQDKPIRTFLFHSSQIWAAEVYPSNLKYPCLPPCFLTGSADGTVRIWKFSHSDNDSVTDSNSVASVNGFNCPELIHLLSPQDPPKELQQDNMSGIKCIKVSPDGLYLGAGEKSGSIRVYDLLSIKQIYCIPVHTGEVLQVDFSPEILNFPALMASGGKDRTIQIYTIDDNFTQLQTLSAHSGAVTCMQFYLKDLKDEIPSLYLISCATDRSIKLFIFTISNMSFDMKHHIVNNTSIYGMDIDPVKRRIAVAGQDKHVRFYSLDELSTRSIGKLSGSGEEKGFSHLAFDPTGRYLVTSSVQKYVLLFDTYAKTFLSHVYGHSEMILSVRFSRDGCYFVSVGGDGCVFVWKLPNDVIQFIHKHILYKGTPEAQNIVENDCEILSTPKQEISTPKELLIVSPTPTATEDTTNWVQTTISKLPPWAQRHLISNTDDQTVKRSLTPDSRSSKSMWGLPIPSGKWAQRAESMMNLTTPENLLNTAMIDTSFSTHSTSSYSVKGTRTEGDGEESPISDNQPFTPYIQNNDETPVFNPLCVVVGSSLKHRSTSLSALYEQRKDDIALASMVPVSKPSPIEECSDIENIDVSFAVSENPLIEDTSDIVGNEVLSVSQPLASVDSSLLASVTTSRSTLCYSESESDNTPTCSPRLPTKLKHQISKSAVIERAISMQSLSSPIPIHNKIAFTNPIFTHPLSNASSLQQLANLSPSLSPAGESKLLQKFNQSKTQFSFSTNNIASVGNENVLTRSFTRKSKKKLPNIPNSPMMISVRSTDLAKKTIRSETLGEKLRDTLDTFVTRTDGLTPELIAKAYPEYDAIVQLSLRIVQGKIKYKDICVNTDPIEGQDDQKIVIEDVGNKLTKLQEVVNDLTNSFSVLK